MHVLYWLKMRSQLSSVCLCGALNVLCFNGVMADELPDYEIQQAQFSVGDLDNTFIWGVVKIDRVKGVLKTCNVSLFRGVGSNYRSKCGAAEVNADVSKSSLVNASPLKVDKHTAGTFWLIDPKDGTLFFCKLPYAKVEGEACFKVD